MSREIPDLPKGWKPPQPDAGRSYEIELITPMVGGGATAGKVDLDFPIRPTAIRGHLRHWWRLVRGHSLGEGMWRREEEIFGSTEFPSPVTVAVKRGLEEPKLYPIGDISSTSTRGYVLFPSIDKQQDLLTKGYQFQLGISVIAAGDLQRRRAAQNRNRKPTEQLPSTIEPIDGDIDAALKSWVIFGGIGARTRRGCGSLRVFKESKLMFLSASPNDLLKQVLREMPKDFRVYQANQRLPHLLAWERCIELLKNFRQPGRSVPRRKFPEAETLRRISGRRGLRNRVVPESELPNGFPRAELGLPIVFQFKDGSGPDGMTALPHGLDSERKQLQRMASPIILKPVPVSATESIQTLIVLRRPKGLLVDVTGASNQPVTGPQFASYPSSPLASTSGSAIEAFINFSRFTEVPR